MPEVTTAVNTQSGVTPMNGSASVTPISVIGPQGIQGTPGPGSAAWTATQAVTIGSVRQAPDGSWISATANRTTRASFDATEQTFWTTILATAATLEQVALKATIAAALATAWVTVQATGGTGTWVTPAGATVIIPKFANNWTHTDGAAPVQFRIVGDDVQWRGAMSRSTGSPSADESMITALTTNLTPSYRGYNFHCRTGGFGNTKGGVIISGDTLRWEEGASTFFYLDGIRYALSNT